MPSSPPPPSKLPNTLLVAFDFDHTLININSDLLPYQSPDILPYGAPLFANISKLVQKLGPRSWTRMMRLQLADLARQEGYTKAALVECLRYVRMDEGLVAALRVLAGYSGGRRPGEGVEGDGFAGHVEMIIASDANDVFIDTVLESNELSNGVFRKVYTNRAAWVSEANLTEEDEAILISLEPEAEPTGETTSSAHSASEKPSSQPASANPPEPTLDVQPYQPLNSPHNCTRCAANMCKSTVLKQSQSDLGLNKPDQETSTVYVGDGFNDYCPALSLGPGDILFARQGYALEKLVRRDDEAEQQQVATGAESADVGGQNGKERDIETKAQKAKVVAQIKYWKTQADLAKLLLELVDAKDKGEHRHSTDEEIEDEARLERLTQDFGKKAVL